MNLTEIKTMRQTCRAKVEDLITRTAPDGLTDGRAAGSQSS